MRRAGRRLPRLRPRRASSSRRCRCRTQAAGCRRAASSSPTCCCASTTCAASPRCSRRPGRSWTCSERCSTAGRGETPSLRDAAVPRRRPTYEAGVERCQEHIRARRRVPDRPLAARRAAHRRLAGRALPRAAPRQPVAVPVPARARRRRARRLVARDARQARREARVGEPDRGLDRAGRGRRRAPALLREGPRRARDARRPRPQRPLARLRARDGEGRAVPRGRALLAHHPPRLGGRGRAARRRLVVRPAARDASRRDRLGRAEGARDADHLRARGLPPRPVRRRRRSTRCPDGTLDSCIAIRTLVLHDGVALPAGGRGDRRRQRPARRARGVPAQARRARSRDRPRGGAADDPADRQLRLVHLQPRAPVRRARGGGRRAAQRRDHGRTRRKQLAPSHLVISPGPGRPEDAGVSRAIVRAFVRPRPDSRRLPRPPGDRPAVRRRGRPARSELVHGKATIVAHDGRGIFAGLPEDFARGPLPLARGDARARRARGLGDRGRRRGDGGAPSRAAGRRRTVPPRVGADAGRARHREELPEGRDDPGRALPAARRQAT